MVSELFLRDHFQSRLYEKVQVILELGASAMKFPYYFPYYFCIIRTVSVIEKFDHITLQSWGRRTKCKVLPTLFSFVLVCFIKH